MSTAKGIVIFDDNRHTRPRPPSTAAAMANNSNAANSNSNNGKILQKRWVCDVCKVKWFLDFKEACAHEAQCNGASPASSSASEGAGEGMVDRETLLISADSNDGSSGSSGNSRGGGGGTTLSSAASASVAGAGTTPLSDKAAAVLAAARAKLTAKNIGNGASASSAVAASAARDEGRGESGRAAAEIVDLSDTEDDSNANISASASSGKEGGTSSSKQPSIPSSSENGTGRRKSKRLRDAPLSKPSAFKDSNIMTSNDTSNGTSSKANVVKKAKKSKTFTSDNSSKSDKPSSKKKGSGSNGGKIASIFLSKKASATSKNDAPSAKESVKDALPGGVTKEEYEEHLAAEKQQVEQRKKKRSAENADNEKAKKKQVTLGKHTKKSDKSAKKKQEVVDIQSSSDDSEEDFQEEDSEDEEFSDKPTKSRKATSTKKPSTASNATIKKTKNFLSKKDMAEHQAADFFAKRKKAAAEERERQKKREELRSARLTDKMVAGGAGDDSMKDDGKSSGKKLGGKLLSGKSSSTVLDSSDGSTGKSSANTSLDMSATQGGGKKVKCIPAVRFPCPSHVIVPDSDSEAESMEMETDTGAKSTSLQVLRETPRYQNLKPESLSNSTEEESCTPTMSFLTESDQLASLERNSTLDLLSSVFDQEGKSNKKKMDSPSSANDVDNNQLWVDKHTMTTIPDDVLGATNKESSQKLLDFVEEWKVRRHKSVQVMGQVKKKKKRRKKKKSGYDSDDSFLDDSENGGGLENIFCITGPTASGKTRLVHAVAEQSECVVIEINSSEVRSGVALKRAIQETTLSHSSLALSKKKQKKSGGDKKDVNGIFGGSGNHDDEDVEYSGEESEDSCFDETSDEEESVRESHSLTIILIDEVDLLFDEDTAFWPALVQVSIKAKCPIVLTSTSVPTELNNVRFKSITLERSLPSECGVLMAQVSKIEGLSFKDDLELGEKLKRLSLIAESCQCDLRKILNEMQLFHFGESSQRGGRSRSSRGKKIDMNNFGLEPNIQYSNNSSVMVVDRPLILSVEPKLVSKDDPTLITITGKNFSSSKFPFQQQNKAHDDESTAAVLFIGGKKCHHYRIVSDTKILAACPPCVIPDGVSGTSAMYETKFSKNIDCLTCKFVQLVIRKHCSNGLVLDSSSRLSLEESSSNYATWNIEYDILLRDSVHEEKKLSREEFIRRSKKAQQRKKAREDMMADNGNTSNDEEEFEKKPALLPVSHENIDDEEMCDPTQKREFEVKEKKKVDPQVMLDEAVAEIGASCEEETSTNEASSAPSSENHSTSSLLEANCFANELNRLSDAILLQDSFSTLAIPSLSGAVEGFGSHQSIESFSATTDPSIDKLCKGKNKKPPSLETIYSTGANESGFFFGNVDSYVTYPNRRRDRQLLSYSELFSRGLGLMDDTNCLLSEENTDNSKSGFVDEEGDTDSTFLQIQTTRVRSEDDILLTPQVSPALLLLPSLLEQGLDIALEYGFTMDVMPLLHLRRRQLAKTALGIMHTALTNCDLWYVGLRHDDDDEAVQKNHVWLRDLVLDHPLSIDYLPYLRAIAQHEDRARRQVEAIMKETGDNMTSRGGRRTRTSSRRKNYRRHYLDECSGGKDGSIDAELLDLVLSAGSSLSGAC